MRALIDRAKKLIGTTDRPLTPGDFCRAWRQWRDGGIEPVDQRLRDHIATLELALDEFDQMHTVVPNSSSLPDAVDHLGRPRL